MGAIYMILNKCNGKAYVGQSVNPNKRWEKHRSLLRHNKHHNSYLQNSWNKHGEESFEFNILEHCDDDKLNDNESWWIDYFDTTDHDKGYNLTDGGDYEYTHHDTTIQKLKQYKGTNHSQFGTSVIDERGGLDKVLECAENGMSVNETAKVFGVAKPTLTGYLKRRGIKWLDISSNEYIYHDTCAIFDSLGGIEYIKSQKEKGKTAIEIADELNINRGAVRRYLSKYGLKWSTITGELKINRKSSKMQRIEDFGGLSAIKEWIRDGKTREEYCEYLDISETTLRRYFKPLNLNWITLKREVIGHESDSINR